MKENQEQDDIKEKEVAIEAATRAWISSFHGIPREVVLKLLNAGDEIVEITPNSTEDCDSFLPMWGFMWCFSDSTDISWPEDENNLRAMADCGFRIYEQEDYGYIFGIDGAGYDFMEDHWIPLYKARGLMWHLHS
jgi:hypothetical protein